MGAEDILAKNRAEALEDGQVSERSAASGRSGTSDATANTQTSGMTAQSGKSSKERFSMKKMWGKVKKEDTSKHQALASGRSSRSSGSLSSEKSQPRAYWNTDENTGYVKDPRAAGGDVGL